jgi:hypothetical protein
VPSVAAERERSTAQACRVNDLLISIASTHDLV